jgi:GNAT superfamily N-acetyltransferase
MDSRVAVFEEHVLSWRGNFLDVEGIVDRSTADVMACTSDVPFFAFNMVLGARFEDWEARAREIAASYLERGRPWCWWTTPSTTSPELEAVLIDLGMVPPVQVAMHRPMEGWQPDAPVSPGIELEALPTDDPVAAESLMTGWAFPEVARPLWAAHGRVLRAQDAVIVVGRLDGVVVGGGVGYGSETSWGLWIIGVTPEARGHGVGGAITARLLDVGKERGYSQTILGATESGAPVYARLGFERVCTTTQWLWQPPTAQE